MPIETSRTRSTWNSGRRRWALALTAIGTVAAMLVTALAATASADVVATSSFENGVATGWTTSGGRWSVVQGDPDSALNTMVYRQSSTRGDARARWGVYGGTPISYTIEAKVQPLGFTGGDRFVAVLARMQSTDDSYYHLSLRGTGRLELRKLVAGASTTLASAAYPVTPGDWYVLRLDSIGTGLRGTVTSSAGVGGPVVSANDSTFTAGNVGLATYRTGAVFDDVRMTMYDWPGSTSGPCHVITNTPGSIPSTGLICPTQLPTGGPTPTTPSVPLPPPVTTPAPPGS